ALGRVVPGGQEGHEEGDDATDDDRGDQRRPRTGAGGGGGGCGHDDASADAPTGTGSRSTTGPAPGIGAETGSIGRRRLPGKAAISEPTAITPPPIHSQTIIGCTITLTPTESSVGGSVMVSMIDVRRVFFTVGLPIVCEP